MKTFFQIFVFLILSDVTFGQDFMPMIQKVWQNNQQLAAKDFEIKSAISLLEEAKSMYGPSVLFNAQYTLSTGGRTILFPIGDLLNPVYNSLNKLNNNSAFGQLENQTINFLPNNFNDIKFKIQQPIYMPDIAINRSLKEGQLRLKELELKSYKRLLSKEIMTAYFSKEQAIALTKILESSGILLTEALRTTQSMITNGIALPSSRLRIEAQQAQLSAQIIEANSQVTNANLYIQFLLGDTVNQEISLPELPTLDLETSQVREEILQLQEANSIMALAVKKEDQFYKPSFGVALDVGSQAFNFGFSPYAFLGLNFEINLYDHKRHQKRKDAAISNMQANSANQKQVADQFALKSKMSENNLIAAIDQAHTFARRISSAERNYKDVFTKYKAGTAGYLEIIDAENLLTSTKVQYALAKFNAWSKWSEYQYDTAKLDIP